MIKSSKKKSSAPWQKSYVQRMKERGFFYLCRWVRSENKEKAIEALNRINRKNKSKDV